MDSKNRFFNKLNASQDLNEAYQRFSKYREEVTGLIINEIEGIDKDHLNMVVFAGGNLMDIDYYKLESMHNKINVLVTDVDSNSIDQALTFLNLSDSSISSEAFNYLGSYFEMNINVLVNQLNLPMISQSESIKLIENFFEGLLAELSNMSYMDYIKIRADIVVVMPIYTQLLYLELNLRLESTKGYTYIKTLILQKMIYVIDAFNQNIVSCLNPSSTLIIFSDIIEEEASKSQDSETSDSIKLKIETYEKTYGVGLGSFGLLNSCDYASCISEYYMKWNFNVDKNFLVKCLILKNLDNQ